MFKTTLEPRTKDEFLDLEDKLLTSVEILEECWDIVEMRHKDHMDSVNADIVASAVKIWARPTADDMDKVHKKICFDAERFGLDLDDYQWAGVNFGELMEKHNGDFTDDGRRLIGRFVQDEHSDRIGEQKSEGETMGKKSYKIIESDLASRNLIERVNGREMAEMVVRNGPEGILGIQELIDDKLVATATPDGDGWIWKPTQQPIIDNDPEIGFE